MTAIRPIGQRIGEQLEEIERQKLVAKPSTIEGYLALSREDQVRLFPHGVALDYGPYKREGKCGFDWMEWESRWAL